MNDKTIPHQPDRLAHTKRVRRARSLAELVRALRSRMPKLSEQYGVQSLGVFGSYLRGEQKPRSDFDVLVEFDTAHNTFHNLIELQDTLQNTLGVKVDLVENQNLKPFIGKRILSEVVWLRRDGKNLRARMPNRKNGGIHMTPKREYLDYMADIVQAMEKLIRFTAGTTYEEFIVNDEKIAAVERNVEIIGEAVKNIPSNVRARYPEIDWKAMAGMRDRLVHGYFARSLQILWETATEKIPEDMPRVAAVLEQELARRNEEEAKGNGKKRNGND